MVLMGIRNVERMAAAGLNAVEEHQIVNYIEVCDLGPVITYLCLPYHLKKGVNDTALYTSVWFCKY